MRISLPRFRRLPASAETGGRIGVLALLAGLAAVPCGPQAAPSPSVAVENGNVVLITGSSRKILTSRGRDSEAAISPDGQWVVYTRAAKPASREDEDEAGDCSALSAPDELRRIRVDGNGDELVLRGRAGAKPEEALCGFRAKQFSSDGAVLFFLSPAWTTSSALHAVMLSSGATRFVIPANDFLILSWCGSDLKDAIVAQQHRYFRFGGSYDWYWLFDPSGGNELGPVGEFDTVEGLKADLDASGQCP
jgi:hypothetical protein